MPACQNICTIGFVGKLTGLIMIQKIQEQNPLEVLVFTHTSS